MSDSKFLDLLLTPSPSASMIEIFPFLPWDNKFIGVLQNLAKLNLISFCSLICCKLV